MHNILNSVAPYIQRDLLDDPVSLIMKFFRGSKDKGPAKKKKKVATKEKKSKKTKIAKVVAAAGTPPPAPVISQDLGSTHSLGRIFRMLILVSYVRHYYIWTIS